MEMKPNITPTPLQYAKDEKSGIWIVFYTTDRIDFDGETGEELRPIMCDYHTYCECDTEEQAQAIVTAVNCTYGANINPEKIQGLINALEGSRDLLMKYSKINFGESYPEEDKVKFRAIRIALNNIKYKD